MRKVYYIICEDEHISTNAKYGLILHNNGCFVPTNDTNVSDVKLFGTKNEADKYKGKDDTLKVIEAEMLDESFA